MEFKKTKTKLVAGMIAEERTNWDQMENYDDIFRLFYTMSYISSGWCLSKNVFTKNIKFK